MTNDSLQTSSEILSPECGSGSFLSQALASINTVEVKTVDSTTFHSFLNTPAHFKPIDTESFTGFDLFITNPPFGAYVDQSEAFKACPLKTTKTELIFLYLSIKLLRRGGRLCTIIPEGVLFGNTKAHSEIRTEMIEQNELDALVSLPSGVFKPSTGASTVLLLLTKGKATEKVWFAQMKADGFSLDQKRRPVTQNDIPDILRKWAEGDPTSVTSRTGQSFFVPVAEIRKNDYQLSSGRYSELEVIEEEHKSPKDIILELIEDEKKIAAALDDLLEMTLALGG
jgi:type I restriction enzyme M protein